MALPISPARTPNSKNMYVELLHHIIFCEDVVGLDSVKNGVIHATAGREWVGYDGLLSHA